MEQFRQIAEALGSLNALMVFQDNIRINRCQCLLLVESLNLAFEGIAEEIRQNLKFNEKSTKWNALEFPLRELCRIIREGEQYIKQCLETKDWWAKAISLNQSTDCIDFHLHNLLWCLPVVFKAIESVGEISGFDQEAIQNKRLVFMKKYDRDWLDPQLFQKKFGGQYLVSREMCRRLDSVWKEDQWILSETVSDTALEQEIQLNELLIAPKGKIYPSSVLVGSKDYQVKRRLGNGRHCKEIQWMGESFALKHFVIDEIEQFTKDISPLTSLRHPNVMQVMYAFFNEERKECFLIMELMNKALSSYIKEMCSAKKRLPFTLLVAVDTMIQIARGMEYLHSRKIYHGDLNPSSILVKSRNATNEGYLHVKIKAFRFSGAKNVTASTDQTTPSPCIWYAPEVLAEQEQSPDTTTISKFTEKADVYSFAMICFELLTGKPLFEDDILQEDKMRSIRGGERPLFPFPSPKYLTNLIRRCWQTDPSHRPTFSSICRMLRYIKRLLILNLDNNLPDTPTPPVDYFDLDMSLSKIFTAWTTTEALKVSEIPFQMFAYRLTEKDRTSLNLREKSSESGSEEASTCGDDNGLFLIQEASLSSPVASSKSSSPHSASESRKKATPKKMDAKAKMQNGDVQKGGSVRPPQRTLHARTLRINSENRMRVGRGMRRLTGHASDSELA